MSRRAVLAAGGGIGGAVVLASCAADDPADGVSTSDVSETTDEAGTTDEGETTEEAETTGEETTEATPAGESVGTIADVPVGGAVAVTAADGTELLLTRPTEGEVLAFSAICTHNGCGVDPGEGTLVCPCHRSTFDIATGEVTGGPAEDPLPPISIEVTDDGTIVLV